MTREIVRKIEEADDDISKLETRLAKFRETLRQGLWGLAYLRPYGCIAAVKDLEAQISALMFKRMFLMAELQHSKLCEGIQNE